MSDTTTDLRRKRRREPAKDRKACEPGCTCVQCTMRTLIRPRYFAGQMLTDLDLGDEQAYQIAKDRLHNRYLHGYGVVCGLQVACDDCDPGSVVIRPGYALGPCGEDILVPCAETLDVVAAIGECRRRESDCDPLERRPRDIDRADEHWCITLAYDEQQVTPRAALRPAGTQACGCSEGRGCSGGKDCGCGGKSRAGSCGCGGKARAGSCGCNGNGNGDGNGNGNGHAHKGSCGCGGTCTCGAVPARVYEPGKGLACEPTRVRETYRLGVVERACATCDTSLQESELYRAGREVGAAWATFTGRVGMANLLALALYAFVPFQSLPTAYRDPQVATTRLLQGKRAVWDLYEENPLGIACPDLATVKAVRVLEADGSDGRADQEWHAVQQRASLDVLTLGFRYLWEYLCAKLQPPCPPDPCDDRLVLACVTVRDGRVVRVCNFACRKRAGSFTARDYWLSLTGIKPLVLLLLERLCCGELIRARSPIRNRVADLLDVVDPGGRARAGMAKGEFRRVRKVAADLSRLRDQIDVPRVVAAVQDVLAREEGVDFVDHLDRSVPDVERDLDRAGVAHTTKEVEAAPLLATLRAARVRAGEDVVLLRDANTGRLAGVERAGRPLTEAEAQPRTTRAAGATAVRAAGVEELAEEVAQLRSELASLRRRAAPAQQAPAREQPRARKATAKKAAAKKATAKKAPAKKAPARRKATAKKATAKKATTRKATAKKAAGKKAAKRPARRRRGGGGDR